VLTAYAVPTWISRAFGGQGFYAAGRGIPSFDPTDSSEYACSPAVDAFIVGQNCGRRVPQT
jgi:hypothetical protein